MGLESRHGTMGRELGDGMLSSGEASFGLKVDCGGKNGNNVPVRGVGSGRGKAPKIGKSQIVKGLRASVRVYFILEEIQSHCKFLRGNSWSDLCVNEFEARLGKEEARIRRTN